MRINVQMVIAIGDVVLVVLHFSLLAFREISPKVLHVSRTKNTSRKLQIKKHEQTSAHIHTQIRTQPWSISIHMKKFDQNREITIRKSILQIFNKRREDFDSLRNYNDYLEEVEDIIYNKVNGINVEWTNSRIREYQEENKSNILSNQKRQQKREQEERFKREKQQQKQHQQQLLQQQEGMDQVMGQDEDEPMTSSSSITTSASQQQLLLSSLRQPKALISTATVTQAATTANTKNLDATTWALRLAAGGYNPSFTLNRAKLEANQTVF